MLNITAAASKLRGSVCTPQSKGEEVKVGFQLCQGTVRVTHLRPYLPPIPDLLVEDAVLVADAVAIGCQPQRGHGVQETGCPGESRAVSWALPGALGDGSFSLGQPQAPQGQEPPSTLLCAGKAGAITLPRIRYFP